MHYIDNFDLRFPSMDVVAVAAQHPSSWHDVTAPSGQVRTEPAPVVVVDGSRWLALCPGCYCAGAERVSFSSRLFFCCECRNAEWDHDLLTVPVPDNRLEIEAALLKRSSWRVRAWRPGESVADLKAQNLMHGVV